MATDIRPETSKKNKYWISKHRYYELLHWCRQYDEWWDEKCALLGINQTNLTDEKIVTNNKYSPVENLVIKIEKLNKKIETLQDTAKEADAELSDYIIFSVTQGVGYTNLKMIKDIPCSKNYFYESYRRFFWLLDKKLS